MSEALKLSGVEKQLGGIAMGFDFMRPQGSVTAIMGASGSGKSTLLNLVAGFLKPDSGSIYIGGHDVTDLPPAERGISMVFQENNLFAHLDIATNIGLGLHPALRLDQSGRASVSQALARVGLSGYEKRLPGTLSGGERQRVALARAFARKAPLLLLDEPFDGLGPGLAGEMVSLMLEIRREVGATVMMVTHDPDEAQATADSILFVDKGHIIADSGTKGFFERQDIPALSAYLGSRP